MSVKDQIEIANHPELEKALLDYQGILDFLDEGLESLKRHVNKYQAEDAQSAEAQAHFALRLRQLYHKPILEPSHQIHMAHLNQAIKWGGVAESAISDFLDDVSGQQTSASDFFAQMLWYRIGLGRVGVLVDGPIVSTSGKSQEQARADGERSYQILYRADQIKYWEFALYGPRKGQLIKLVLDDEPRMTEQGKTIPRVRRFFYPDDTGQYIWQILELESGGPSTIKQGGAKKYNVVAEGVGQLQEIPFVFWGRGIKDSLYRMSWTLEKASLNNASVKTNILYRQGFQRTIVTGAADNELKTIGESIINKVNNPDAKVWTVEAGSPEGHFREEGSIESRTQRICLLQNNQLVDDTRQVQSAESKSKDMAAREKFYNKILDEAQRKLSKIWALHYEFEGITGAEKVQISISRDFNLRAADEEIAERNNITYMARQIGADDVTKEVLKTEISKTNFTVTNEQETESDLKKRLYDAVDSAKQPELSSPFQSATRPSIGAAFRPNG